MMFGGGGNSQPIMVLSKAFEFQPNDYFKTIVFV